MELIDFTKEEKPKQEAATPKTTIEDTPIVSQVMQFFGIINIGAKSIILIGPYDDENKTLSKLIVEVEKLMSKPETELIVGEDSAIVYQKIDDELIVCSKVDINEILDDGDDE